MPVTERQPKNKHLKPRRKKKNNKSFTIFLLIAGMAFAGVYLYISRDEKYIQGNSIVTDGDTIKISGHRIRLMGIDAPELSQLCKDKETFEDIPCGKKSKQYLQKLINNQLVSCKRENIDMYKRIVGECFVENLNLNKEMVKQGHALAYREYSEKYIEEERIAKQSELGIWGSIFKRPQEFRKQKRLQGRG